ncbi:MAG: Tm-1-like ATP-binding domain-containing protein, partial [Syntrophomonadaceae bacterium]|nr:Tm-1-like ATP-binding domain-containing protein [Syntrophomonadaceae bacterium]
MTGKIVVLGTLDTKGAEFKFIRDVIEAAGVPTLVVDAGVLGEPFFPPDVRRDEVAAAAGVRLEDLVARRDRGE